MKKDLNVNEQYVNSVKAATASVNDLAKKYTGASEVLTKSAIALDMSAIDSKSYVEKLQTISKNLGALNSVYELQLKSTNEQVQTASKLQEQMNKFINNINDSIESTSKYKEQAALLTQNISILKKLGSSETHVQVHSRATGMDYSLEAELIKPIISGADVQAYGTPQPENVLIFPYEVDRQKQRASLIPPATMESRFGETWAYLNENRAVLEGREGGRFIGNEWYALGRSQNLGRQHLQKICVPRLVDRLCAIWDEHGEFVLDNVDVGGITLREKKCSPLYVVALLNSAAAHFYLRARSTTFRGGFLSANRQFLGKIPVPLPENMDSVQKEALNSLEAKARRLILLSQSCSTIRSSFESNLLSTLPITAGKNVNFNIDYYSTPAYWKTRRLIPANGLELTDPVVAMRIENGTLAREQGFSATSRLIISYQSDKQGPWKPIIEIEPANEDLRLFILLATRRFLAENTRKKNWHLPEPRLREGPLMSSWARWFSPFGACFMAAVITSKQI